MRFSTNDEELAVTVELDGDEAQALDLTDGDLGGILLGMAVDGMRAGLLSGKAPDGTKWAPLTSRTAAQKGHSTPGIRSGAMAADLERGETEITPTSARWAWPKGETWPRAHGFHNGRFDPRHSNWIQPPRPLVGWTREARVSAQTLVKDLIQ